jgi:hypothetical protein
MSQKTRKSSLPKITLTSDIPLHLRRHVPENLTVNVEKANIVIPSEEKVKKQNENSTQAETDVACQFHLLLLYILQY